ncbi:MAG: hypothetical protein J2O48_08180, partial [Solirubrobacterales bacterium]|nr:hypothetical protein [Solirubrobacterales bacterium]
ASTAASQLAQVSNGPLQRVPAPAGNVNGGEPAAGAAAQPAAATAPPAQRPTAQPTAESATSARTGTSEAKAAGPSRRVLWTALALLALIVIAAVVVLIATSGSKNKQGTKLTTEASLPLQSPSGAQAGTARVLGSKDNPRSRQLDLTGHDLAAANPGTYAVWLYNTNTKASHLLGFDSQMVAVQGQLSMSSALPANASSYNQVLLTKETTQSPSAPGKIFLKGNFHT